MTAARILGRGRDRIGGAAGGRVWGEAGEALPAGKLGAETAAGGAAGLCAAGHALSDRAAGAFGGGAAGAGADQELAEEDFRRLEAITLGGEWEREPRREGGGLLADQRGV